MAKRNHEARPMYRQGDVFIERIDAAPEGLTPVDTGERVILAYGEVTGHAHALSRHDAKLYAAKAWADRVLVVAKATALLHEEHAPITLPAGTYRIRLQREYTPEAIRTVAD